MNSLIVLFSGVALGVGITVLVERIRKTRSQLAESFDEASKK